MNTKKWYQSKIVLIAIAMAGTFGYNILSAFLGNQGVTPDQLSAIQQAYPELSGKIGDLTSGGLTVTNIVGFLGSVGTLVARIFFTSKLLPQSIK